MLSRTSADTRVQKKESRIRRKRDTENEIEREIERKINGQKKKRQNDKRANSKIKKKKKRKERRARANQLLGESHNGVGRRGLYRHTLGPRLRPPGLLVLDAE